MKNVNGMGNMSTLEQKVDVLLQFCTAQTDTERNACYSTMLQLQRPRELGTNMSADVAGKIETVLRELGIRDHLTGYMYLCSAVRILLENQYAGRMFTKILYPQIAKLHNTVPASVERSIRHAIETGWLHCDYKTQEKYFGNQIDPDRAKPTNVQFIVRVTNAVRRSIFKLQN